VLAVVVVTVVASVVAKVLLTGLDVYSLIVNRHDATQNARFAMERMVDEIVLIESSDITWLGSTNFGFRDTNNEQTSFKIGVTSIRGQIVPCMRRGNDFLASLAPNITGGYLDFDYLRDDGSNTYLWWLVRRINIDLGVDADAGAGSVCLRTNIYPRNFMYSNFE